MRTLATEFDLEIMYVCVCSTNLHITPILFIRIVKIIHVFTLIGRNSGGILTGAGGQFSFDLPRLVGAGDIASTPPLAQHRMSHSSPTELAWAQAPFLGFLSRRAHSLLVS